MGEGNAIPGADCTQVTKDLCDEQVEDIKSVRQEVMALMGTKPLTIRDMIRVVRGDLQSLLKFDACFDCDAQFLFDHAQPLIEEKVDEDCLACFPSQGGAQVSLQETQTKVGQLRRSALVHAAGPGKATDLNGIIELLDDFEDGYSPKDDAIARSWPFYKRCLKALENFVEHEVRGANQKSYGSDALLRKLADIEKEVNCNVSKTVNDFQIFKKCNWLLSSSQRNHVRELLQTVVQRIGHAEGKAAGAAIDSELPLGAVFDRAQRVVKEKAASDTQLCLTDGSADHDANECEAPTAVEAKEEAKRRRQQASQPAVPGLASHASLSRICSTRALSSNL